MIAESPSASHDSVICVPAVTTVALAVNVLMTGGKGVALAGSVAVAVGVLVFSGVKLGVIVAVFEGVNVAVAVLVAVAVGVLEAVAVAVGVGVIVGVLVAVGVDVSVNVGKTTRVGKSDIDCSPLLQAEMMRTKMQKTNRCKFFMRCSHSGWGQAILLGIITLILVACQETSVPEQALPTRVVFSSVTPTLQAPTFTPTSDITNTPMLATPVLVVQPATFTPRPTLDIATPTLSSASSDVRLSPTPARPVSSLPEVFAFGQSVQGVDLLAYRVGTGAMSVMLVGGVHGGLESNTVELVVRLLAHFSTNPADILPGVSLVFVPELNPDGMALGRTVSGRFNANGVDLNRNWGCGWSPQAFFRDIEVSAGGEPFSEPETVSLAALINDLRPATVLFYHSAANGVFTGDCATGGVSEAMGAVLGQATDYSFGDDFSAYPVTGTAASWVDGLGIPSADVELATADFPEFDRNLRGVMALQCWLVGEDVAITQAQCR